MDNLSTAISSQIGALEMGEHLESDGDGVLEKAGSASFGPTHEQCTIALFCRRV
jgi:hypothetical protein